jgi:hypothetical protein
MPGVRVTDGAGRQNPKAGLKEEELVLRGYGGLVRAPFFLRVGFLYMTTDI